MVSSRFRQRLFSPRPLILELLLRRPETWLTVREMWDEHLVACKSLGAEGMGMVVPVASFHTAVREMRAAGLLAEKSLQIRVAVKGRGDREREVRQVRLTPEGKAEAERARAFVHATWEDED